EEKRVKIKHKLNYSTPTPRGKASEEDTTETPLAPVKVMQDVDMSTTGFRIQLAREDLGLTEADLARALNTYSDHISDWECGVTEPPASVIIPLANALKCDPLWLLGDFDGIEPPALTEAPLAPVKIMQGVDMSTIGNRIRQRRNELSMSTINLAKETGTHLMDVVNWESGLVKPEAPYIDALAKALSTSVTWLLTGRQIIEKDA
ncbi:hypothetical protein CYD30_28745, partial [Kosakonia cowanii]